MAFHLRGKVVDCAGDCSSVCFSRNCPEIGRILEIITETYPSITDEVICKLAGDISNQRLQSWRTKGTARNENVQRLVEQINNMPEDWDGRLIEVGDCMGSSFNR